VGGERRKAAVKMMAMTMVTVMAYDHDHDHDQDRERWGVEEGHFEEGWSERER
jgi:ParB-like chromosome segregation protein Spo0J